MVGLTGPPSVARATAAEAERAGGGAALASDAAVGVARRRAGVERAGHAAPLPSSGQDTPGVLGERDRYAPLVSGSRAARQPGDRIDVGRAERAGHAARLPSSGQGTPGVPGERDGYGPLVSGSLAA